MYQKYTTEGFLVSVAGIGEADKIVSVFTNEFGLVTAIAPGIRKLKSKLRFHLKQGSLLRLTFLRAKTSWKIVEIKPLSEIDFPSDAYNIFLKILVSLRMLVQGEEKNEKLFGTVKSIYEELLTVSEKDEMKDIECMAMLNIVTVLGYGTDDKELETYRHDFEKGQQISDITRKKIINHINLALKESGL